MYNRTIKDQRMLCVSEYLLIHKRNITTNASLFQKIEKLRTGESQAKGERWPLGKRGGKGALHEALVPFHRQWGSRGQGLLQVRFALEATTRALHPLKGNVYNKRLLQFQEQKQICSVALGYAQRMENKHKHAERPPISSKNNSSCFLNLDCLCVCLCVWVSIISPPLFGLILVNAGWCSLSTWIWVSLSAAYYLLTAISVVPSDQFVWKWRHRYLIKKVMEGAA